MECWKEERTRESDNIRRDKHEKCTKREMTYGIYSGGDALRSYAFVGANHLQFIRQFYLHKLTVLWNIYLNWSS